MGARAFAILSIACLVIGLVLALTLPPGTTLQSALYRVDAGGALANLQALSARWLPHFFWPWVIAPLLVRPVWLLPATVGLISLGGTATLASRSSSQPRRRRW